MEPSRSMLRIFVGCTSRDLEKHRDAVRHLVDMFDEHPVVMGDFGARDGDATDVSLERVRSCDIYVLLLGWRYGTIPADETFSVTHLEYRAARDAGKPRLIFLAHQDTEADDGPTAIFPAAVRDEEHSAQLRDFRAEVAHDHVAAFFTTPDNAAALVAAALHRFLREREPSRPRPPLKLAPRAPEFVGRTSELADLCQRLRSGQSVGLSALVSGLGGVGKSALAAEALATLAADPDTFPGGITWVRCDGREGHDGLAWLYDQLLADWGAPLSSEQLAQAQTVSREAEVELRERALQNCLRASISAGQPPSRALVLLDNVEVGLPLARALDALMSLGITALVTARHQPSVARLAVMRLDVLDAPAAAELFAERYRAQGGAWDDPRASDAAAAIVEQLGWLPLAIELQAARAALRGMSVTQVIADLDHDRSQGLLGDPLDATRTLRYSFAQSLRTLTPLQRTRFAALGLPGGSDWPRAVIEWLFAGIQENAASDAHNEESSASELASAQADLDVLAALSLINPAEGRIQLHPLVRNYAHELWRVKPHSTQTQGLRTLLAGISATVSELEHDFTTLALEAELIVAALDAAQESQAAPKQVIDIADMLTDYLALGGHWRMGMRIRRWQLAACRAVGDRANEGRVLNNLGYLASSLGQKDEARHYYEQALLIRREVDDRSGEGITLCNLGLLADNLGQKTEAKAYYEQALAIQRQVGDRSGEGTTLNNLGGLANRQGQPEEAHGYYEQALRIWREVGDRKGEGTAFNNLGGLADDLGRLDEARHYYEQALAIHREVGNRAMEGTTLNNLGALARRLGQPEQARAYYEQALAIAREVGNRSGEGKTLSNLGALARQLGQPEEASVYYQQALAIHREVGDRAGEGTTLNNLGLLAHIMRHVEQARGYYQQALAIFQEIGAVDDARITVGNLNYLDSESAAPSDASEGAPPILPAEKTPLRKRRRWPWRR